jgi:hypothetical protein
VAEPSNKTLKLLIKEALLLKESELESQLRGFEALLKRETRKSIK